MKPIIVFVVHAFLLALPLRAVAQDLCAGKDPARHVAGGKECLVYKAFGLETAGKNPVLAIWLHGDVSRGGPANYMYPYAEQYSGPGIVNVALIRPGYDDGEGNTSTGDNNGRRDNNSQHNVDAIAGAVSVLRERFRAKEVGLLGHSGGAAAAGVILGRHPGLASRAVLVSCPCDLYQWWSDRRWRGMPRSISPHDFAEKIPGTAKVFLITGDSDDVVYSHLSKRYESALVGKGIKVKYHEIHGGTHLFSTLGNSPVFTEVMASFIGEAVTSHAGGTASPKK